MAMAEANVKLADCDYLLVRVITLQKNNKMRKNGSHKNKSQLTSSNSPLTTFKSVARVFK